MSNAGSTGKPFEGIRILDFSQVIAGPVASQLLNASGAQIIKIEAPGKGDQLRSMVLSPHQDRSRDSAAFNAVNRGKQSICLDLKSAPGRQVALRMAALSDVVIENFRPGVMSRLGLDYASIKAVRQDIIYCSLSGYGQTGPLSARPAYDSAIQAASGMMSNTGHPETGPTRTGYTPVDVSAGMLAGFAVSSALLRRERTGEGQYLDVAMLDAAMMLQVTSVAASLDDGGSAGLNGNASPAHSLTADCFPTKDGSILLSALIPAHGHAVMRCLNLPESIWDEYRQLPADAAQAIQYHQQVGAVFASKESAYWADQFLPLGIAFERVNSVREATELEQQAFRNILDRPKPVERSGPTAHRATYGGAFMANADGPDVNGADSPALGEHTQNVLETLGFKAEEIAALSSAGAFGAPTT